MVFGLLLLLVSLTTAQTAHKTFTCSFTLTNEPLFPSGSATGVLRFDWGRHKHDFTYAASSATAASSQQIFSYNSNGGYTSTTEQFFFYKTTACACTSAPLSTAQPPFLFDRTVITANTDGSYKPTNGNTGFTKLTFNAASGFIESAIDNTGKTYKFTGCTDSTFSDTTWNPPTGCDCGTPSDVVLVLDRSSSITADLFVLEKDFVTQLVNAFTYGPVATNLGITNFHTLTWDGPVNLRDGTTAAAAKAGAAKLACAPDAQCHVFSSGGTCCGTGTSISSGIINGVDMLVSQASKTDVRKGAAKVLIVFTDGAHGKPLLRVGDVLTLDALGKPQGTDGTFTAAQLTADIQYAVDYAKRKIPSIVIYAVAAGPTFNNAQLLTIASGDASRVFADRDWNKLSGFVNKLVTTTCTSTADIAVNSCCAPNSCSAWCKNYKIVGGPTCADGNTASGDGCSATCTVEKGWTCPATCAPICGDSIILGAEKCDDGNTKPGDGCSATCTIEDGWSCPNPGKPCTAVCGDKKIAGSEQCDDGNIVSGDGCSSTCFLESGYDCPTLGVACTARCGDSLKVGKEQCDDGNTKAGDGCSATCTIEEGYSCPDAPGKPCKDVDECKTYGCGTVATCTESGNTSGAGKVAIGKRVCTCPTPGYTVTKLTTVSVTLTGAATFAGCSGVCGDSLIVKGEECDDGGVFSGDGCSSTCTTEAGAVCPDPGLRCCLPLPMEPTEPVRCWNGYWVPKGQKRDD